MQAYILSVPRPIPPLDVPAAEIKIHNVPLRAAQQRILESLGCTVEVIDDVAHIRQWPCLLVHADVFFTPLAVRGFLKQVRGRASAGRRRAGDGRRSPANYRAALALSSLTENFTAYFQGDSVTDGDGRPCRVYDVYYLEGLNGDQAPAEQAAPLRVPHRVRRRNVRVSRVFEPNGRFLVPVSTVYFTPIRHWSTVVSANLLGMPGHILSAFRKRPAYAATLPARVLWRSGSLRPKRWQGALYLAGEDCRVHPTAYVEMAVLGNGVRVGPGAIVRGAVIDDKALIGAGSIVEGCSLGREAVVSDHTIVRSCVIGDEANVGIYVNQFSLFGRGAVACPSSLILDFTFRGTVRVRHEGRTVDSGSRVLGGCLGPGAFMSPGVWLAAGYEVPAGTVLIQDSATLVRDVDRGLPPGVRRLGPTDIGTVPPPSELDASRRRVGSQ